MRSITRNILICITIIAVFVAVYFFVFPNLFSTSYDSQNPTSEKNKVKGVSSDKNDEVPNTNQIVNIPVAHISTPEQVKAIYVSAWVAGSKKELTRILSIIDTTEINSIVIDVKDSTGRVSFFTDNELINSIGSSEKRIANIAELISTLHSKNIYVIGRISVFQDPYLTNKKPEWAVKRKSDGKVWKDRKGLSFIDPTNKDAWDYTIAVATTAYNLGFDEINFDYIRYPSDGNIKDINYNLTEGDTRAGNLEKFFIYLSTNMKKDVNIPISADLFGLTTTLTDDMGIGQMLEKALPHFDFIAPMVYPSHYPNGWNGYKNPADHPYDVVQFSMSKAFERATLAGVPTDKLRPWLQDFDLGAVYTKEMVRAQIKATNDVGLDSWMLWDAKNQYTKEALLAN